MQTWEGTLQGTLLWSGPGVCPQRSGTWMPVMLGMVIARENMTMAKKNFPPVSLS